MKKILVVVFIAVIFIFVAVFSGIAPLNLVGTLDTKTKNIKYGAWKGTGELLQNKGYICSYKQDGESQTINIAGKLKVAGDMNPFTFSDLNKAYYKIYGHTGVGWEVIGKPGMTSKYLVGNINYLKLPKASYNVGIWNAPNFETHIVGNDLKAIRVEFWCHIDANVIEPFGPGYEWKKMQTDYAYLYEGQGGLYLPRGLEEEYPDLPYSTFEIGTEVRIGVETGTGGTSSGDNWMVTLNEPIIGGSITEDDLSTGVVKKQFFPDNCDASNTFFTFTVTEEMAKKSMQYNQPYTIRIWNSLLPKGTLNVDFVDFWYKCPSKPSLDGDIKTRVNSKTTVSMTADVNPSTQADIDFFRVSVVYGEHDKLLPSDWSSGRWIVHTTDIGKNNEQACSLPQSISFTPTKESWVTVFVKPFDVEGRPSRSTSYWSLYVWEEDEPPDDSVEDDAGEGDYGGGKSEDNFPWEPGEGNWDNYVNEELLKIIAIVFVLLVFGLLAFVIKTPIPGGMIGRMLLFFCGIAISIAIWFLI